MLPNVQVLEWQPFVSKHTKLWDDERSRMIGTMAVVTFIDDDNLGKSQLYALQSALVSMHAQLYVKAKDWMSIPRLFLNSALSFTWNMAAQLTCATSNVHNHSLRSQIIIKYHQESLGGVKQYRSE